MTFDEKKSIAYQENKRVQEEAKKAGLPNSRRGENTIYSEFFPNHFLWLFGQVPHSKQAVPAETYVNSYGVAHRFEAIIPRLEEMLGEKFRQLFGFPAGRAEYQYLSDLITAGTVDYEPSAPLNLTRTKEWLTEQLAKQPLESPANDSNRSVTLQWAATKVDLAELAYALIESGAIKLSGSRAEAVADFAEFFGVKIGKPEKHLGTIKKRVPDRNVKIPTLFLDKLKSALQSYLDKH
jgi:hypothetical protein